MPSDQHPHIHTEIEPLGDTGLLARVTVDNPMRLNFLDSDLIRQLTTAIRALEPDRQLRCVVLSGAGDRAFIGGADIREMVGLDSASAHAFITRLHLACAAIRELPVPIIARIHGYCLGAGPHTITRWVDAGAPQGNPADLPELPTFNDGWQLGEPDLIARLDDVTVPADGPDYYPDLSYTLDIPEKRWIRAIEVKPDNRKVAHHSVIFTGSGGAEGNGRSGFFEVLAVWSVGTNPHEFPDGMGRWVYPGQTWDINAHYHPSGTEETDRTEIGLYWGEGELQKEVIAALAGTVAFEIPANAANHEIRSSYIIDQDVSVISYFPHMHYRGKDMDLIANFPNGESRSLINIPKYDFDWQLFYYPAKPVPLPAGTRLDIIAHYDNSAANPKNPDPNKDVGFGL